MPQVDIDDRLLLSVSDIDIFADSAADRLIVAVSDIDISADSPVDILSGEFEINIGLSTV